MTEEIKSPNYYAILTSDVRYSDKLKPSEKLLYAEITALTNEHGFCWATNDYFAQLYSVTDVAVSRWIKALEKNGFLKIEYDRNGTYVTQRRLYPLTKMLMAVNQNVNGTVNQKVNGAINQNVKENNLNIFNNLNINNKDIYVNIIHDYNNICGDKLPKVTIFSEKRFKKIENLKKEIKDIDFKLLFTKAYQSSFLTGSTGWKCNFDWLINPTNAIKVLEGNYMDNKAGDKGDKNRGTNASGKVQAARESREDKTISERAEEIMRRAGGPIENIECDF